MSDNRAKVKPGKSGVRDQPHTLMKSQADQRVNAEHQFFHARRPLTSFIPDHNNISRHDLSCLDRLECRPVPVKDLCLPPHILHFIIHGSGPDNCAVWRQVAPQDLKSRLLEQGSFQRVDNLVFPGRYLRKHLLPGNAVHARNLCKQFAFQHLHHIHYTARIMKIHHRIRTTWNHRIDAGNLFGIFFKILQRKPDPKLIGKG